MCNDHQSPEWLSLTRREVMGPVMGGGLAAAGSLSMPVRLAAATNDGAAPAQAAGGLSAFALTDVRLSEGPFLHAQRKTAAYLLSLDPDRLLHGFRVNAGLPPRAPVYGGWESAPTWADIHCQGHTLGHYLSACALMFAASGDPRFKQRADHIVTELASCQAASGNGLLCAFPEGPKLVADFIAGGDVSGVPWYTMHKTYAGLRDAYQQTGNARAREVLVRFADWTVVATRPLSDERFEAMLNIEHGGMNEVFADLYAMTGEFQYRHMAERFSHKAVLAPLAKREDHLDGLHANTQIPKVVGFERVAETTGEPSYREAAAFFWRTVTRSRSYAHGGHGDGEHFFPIVEADQHVFSAKGSETCGIYNMLKLTRLLMMADPRAEYGDFYERALFNGILGSQDPASGMVTYFQGARPDYPKLYCTPEDSFWCCTGTGMENHAKYGESIYFHDDRSLLVNLFIPSTVVWREKRAKLTQATAFPEQPGTRLTWTLAAPTSLVIRLRHPAWSRTAEVRINGKIAARSDEPGSFVAIDRTWRDGDVVDLALDMRVAAAPLPANPDVFALTYGPLVLAAALGDRGIAPGSDIVVNERKYGEYLDAPIAAPLLAGTPATIGASVHPAAEPLTFSAPAVDGDAVRLVPYHRIAHQRYALYWRSPSSNA